MEDSLILNKKEFNSILNTETVFYSFLDKENAFIQKGFLLYLINTDEGYKYLFDAIDNKLSNLKIVYLNNNEIAGKVSIEIACLLSLLEDIEEVNKERLEEIKSKCDLKQLIKDYKDEIYYQIVNNKGTEIRAIRLVELFLSGQSKLEEYFNVFKKIGLSKREVMYLVNSFFKDEEIVKRYVLPKEVIQRYMNLTNYKMIDFESINRISSSKLKGAYIDENLKGHLYKGINENYTDLEKAIYLYIRMCKYLSYDPSYYVNDSRDGVVALYDDPSRLKDIKDDKHNIVCYEFNYMYAKLLEELNIPYESSIRKLRSGGGHANLEFVYGKYIVLADAVTSVFNGDLVNAKINTKLVGLKCLNKCESTVEEFNDILEKVYNDIITEEIENNLSDAEICNLLLIYRKLTNAEKKENVIKRKMDILLSELSHPELKTMDAIGYALKLRNIIFSPKERMINFAITVLKYQNDDVKEPVMIITINETENINISKNNKYYFYVPGNKAKKIKKEVLELLLENNELEYISYAGVEIPGVGGSVKGHDREITNKK